MSSTRAALPWLDGGPVALTDGGLETVLLFRQGIDLPAFAAFPLLDSDDGRRRLLEYYREAAATAAAAGAPFTIDTATWRANPEWAAGLGYVGADYERVVRAAVALAVVVRDECRERGETAVVCGVLGPRGDGYRPNERGSAADFRHYHSAQLRILADSPVDYVAALTITTSEEAQGVVEAAGDLGLPVVVSFTVETDGLLASGQPLGEAIEAVDAATGGAAVYFGVNCAHPTHLPPLDGGEPWTGRVRSFRANASRRSHAELDEATELDDGDPDELGRELADLLRRAPQLRVLGGCCGTDDRHLRAIARSCLAG